VSVELQRDYKLVLKAVEQDSYALEYASVRLRCQALQVLAGCPVWATMISFLAQRARA
jgi:hypothetical protein